MLRIMLLCLLAFFAAPALAIYKCDSQGKVSYGDEPCPGGQALNIGGTPPANADTAVAEKRTAQEKTRVKRLENERHKREAQDEKELQRAAHAAAAKQKKCALLARRQKWANEDAAAATGKSSAKARLKARRVAEQFDTDCRK
jgi:type IV secretory pathway VirB10-like protein